jgi:hypothetical protein
MARSGTTSAPLQITWIICVILYVVALLAAFGVVAIPAPFGLWAWVIGFGLLLVACRVRGL